MPELYFIATAEPVIGSFPDNRNPNQLSYFAKQLGDFGYGKLENNRPRYSQPYNLKVPFDRATSSAKGFKVGVLYRATDDSRLVIDKVERNGRKQDAFAYENLIWEEVVTSKK